MEKQDQKHRIDRRVALQWISAATASIPFLDTESANAQETAVGGKGYGPDPDLLRIYQPGDLWPLTFSESQRAQVIVLCDIIIPADETSPSASEVGVHDFIDEWISSPYPGQKSDRNLVLKGLDYLESEKFLEKSAEEQLALCSQWAVNARKNSKAFPGSFFRKMRDLVAGGYYTTPEGAKDIGYRGNVAMAEWNGPPPEVLEKIGLPPQP